MIQYLGVEAPQFQFGSDPVVELDYIKIIKDEAEKIQILHESVITRYREWDDLGKHWIFTVQVHLIKYANPVAKYNELLNYKRSLVTLWRRRDGEPIADINGNPVLFRFNKMGLKYLPFPDYEDVLELEFISQDPIDIKQSLLSESS